MSVYLTQTLDLVPYIVQGKGLPSQILWCSTGVSRQYSNANPEYPELPEYVSQCKPVLPAEITRLAEND